MPKGTPLDPDLVRQIGELYAQTGNLSAVARQLELPFETVRDVIARGSNARRRQLLEEALTGGLEEGVDHLRESARELRGVLKREIDAGLAIALDPTGMRDLNTGIAASVNVLSRVRDGLEKSRTLRIQRQKMRAEIERARAETELAKAQTEVFRKKAQEGNSPEEIMKQLTAEALMELLLRIRAEKARATEVPPSQKE